MKKIALFMLAVILTLTACNASNTGNQSNTDKNTVDNTTDKTTDNTSDDTTENTDNNKDETASDVKDDTKKYGIGETVDINGIKITFESVDKSYGDRDEEYSAFYPDEGNVFAVCNFLIENNSSEDLDISLFYFNAYVDGFAVDPYIFTDGIGVKDLSGTASPGKKIKGALVYEVSEDFKELEIEYQPSVWNDKKAYFIYKNEKGS